MEKKRRNDLILIAVLLAVAALGLMYLFLLRKSGDTVRVTVNGELYGVYSLAEPLTEDILTGEDRLNRLVIRDGKAYVERATCPDGICAAHHPIFRDGESIICLPHGVVVTVITGKPSDSPDIVA